MTQMSQETPSIQIEECLSFVIVWKLKTSLEKNKTLEEVLSLSQETQKKFLLSLSVDDQHIESLEAKITFLKDPKAWEADYRFQEDKEEEEDVNTVITNGAGEEIPQEEEVSWDQDDVSVV